MKIDRAVVVAVAGMTWQEFWVERDDFTEQVQLDAAKRFMSHVVNDTKPDYDGAESTYEVIRKMHPLIDDTEIEIDGLHQLALAQQEFEAAESKFNQMKSWVLDLMGNAKHAYIVADGQQIRLASRQARRDGVPYLVVKKGK